MPNHPAAALLHRHEQPSRRGKKAAPPIDQTIGFQQSIDFLLQNAWHLVRSALHDFTDTIRPAARQDGGVIFLSSHCLSTIREFLSAKCLAFNTWHLIPQRDPSTIRGKMAAPSAHSIHWFSIILSFLIQKLPDILHLIQKLPDILHFTGARQSHGSPASQRGKTFWHFTAIQLKIVTMSSYQALLTVTFGFWTIWFILCIIFKKSWIPVIPTVPLLALGVGLALNKVQVWAGTAIVGVMHAMFLFCMIRPFFANRNSKP